MVTDTGSKTAGRHRNIASMFLMLLPNVASAHLPHDTVVALATPPDGDAEAPWYALVEPNAVSALFRSEDRGRSWTAVANDASADRLLDLTLLTDGTLVAAAEERLWWTRDGLEWLYQEAPGQKARLGGLDALLVMTDAGIYAGHPETGLTLHALDPAPQGLHTSVEGTLVWSGTRLWRWEDGPIPMPDAPADVAYAAAGEGRVLLGDRLGRVWADDGATWRECAPLPPDPRGEHNEVRGLAVHDGRFYAVSGWRGPFVAAADCAQWDDVHWSPDPSYTGSGPAPDAQAAFVRFVGGDRLALAGWMGIGISDDRGQSWWSSPLLGGSYTRGLRPSTSWSSNGVIFVGSLGAGVVRTDTTGADLWPGTGLGETNTQAVITTDNPEDVYAIVGHLPWKSSDSGRRWRLLGDFGEVRQVSAPGPDEVWVITEEGAESLLYRSTDAGETWTVDPEPGVGTYLGTLGGQRCLTRAGGAEVHCETAGGAPELVYVTTDRIGASLTLPDGDLLVCDDSGVHRLDATEVVTELVTAIDPMLELVQAGPDLQFGAFRSGRLAIREGGSWRSLDVRLPTQVTTLMTLPDYPDTPALYAATLDGTYRIDDPAYDARTTRWAEIEWLDDQASWLSCEACDRAATAPGQHLVSATQIEADGSVKALVRGRVVRVWGVPGRGELWIDGSYYSDVTGSGSEVTVIAEASGLDAGWHEVMVLAGGGGLQLDGIEGRADPTARVADERCGCRGDERSGCQGSKGTSLLPGVLLFSLRRRRSTGAR